MAGVGAAGLCVWGVGRLARWHSAVLSASPYYQYRQLREPHGRTARTHMLTDACRVQQLGAPAH
mgnify:CR=1 FL=1